MILKSNNNFSDNLSICFYGSSDEGLEEQLSTEHRNLIQKVVTEILKLEFKTFRIITGGYGGIMDSIASEFKLQAKKENKKIQIVGITCDAYHSENTIASSEIDSKSNDFSSANDIIIHAESFPARIQAMIESADLFIVLPGKQGTLNEFLTTYDSFRYPIDMLKDRNKKILIYEDWKELISNPKYFRNFNKNIISFFNSDNFSNRIKDVKPVSLAYFKPESTRIQKEDIEYRFKEYYKKFFEVLYGSISKIDLNFKYGLKNNLLSLDFGYILSDKSTQADDGMFLSYSTSKYKRLIEEFFSQYNSVMLSEKHTSNFEVEYLNGRLQVQTNIKYSKDERIPSLDENKINSTFQTWADFLKSKNYGQTLIWRGITQKGQGENSYKLNLSIFLLFNSQLPSRKIEKIRQLTDEFLVDISTYKIAQLFGIKEKELQRQATRAAISQVMARNMSHNIGSHVMNKLLNANDIKANLELKHYISSPASTSDAIEAMAIFNSYIKARMDYLADVTFGTPVMQTNKKFYGEVFKEFDRNRLLLNNISALGENFKYEVVFKIEGIESNDKNDLEIALPNDLLGCQAFYNILENIIRNTAKHSKDTPKNVDFTVNISDCDDDPSLYKIEVFDNIKHKNTVTKDRKVSRLKEYNQHQPKSGKKKDLSEIDWLVFKQNNTLNESILDEKTNQLRTTALGMIELETSAAYLRKIDIADIESKEYKIEHNEKLKNQKDNLNILKAFNQDGSLGYRFFVLKPSEILLIGNYAEIDDKKTKLLLNEGIWVLSEDEFKESLKSKEVFNHQFLLYEDSELSDEIQSKATSLPTRVIKLQDEVKEKINSILNNKKDFLPELEELIWSEWTGKLFSKNSIEKINVRGSVHPDDMQTNWFHAIFLNHADSWEKNEGQYKKYAQLTADEYSQGKVSYLDALPSSSQQKLPGFIDAQSEKGSNNEISKYYSYINKNTKIKNRIDSYKLAESILSKILVIDERIQDVAVNRKFESDGVKIPFGKLYEYTNIILPIKIEQEFVEKHINLSSKNFDSELISKIKKYISNHLGECDFVLIHYSILERMFSSDKIEINNYLKKIASKIKVVITSGRGKPSELPDCVNYINLTPILDAFIENRSKYSINYLLNSSRI